MQKQPPMHPYLFLSLGHSLAWAPALARATALAWARLERGLSENSLLEGSRNLPSLSDHYSYRLNSRLSEILSLERGVLARATNIFAWAKLPFSQNIKMHFSSSVLGFLCFFTLQTSWETNSKAIWGIIMNQIDLRLVLNFNLPKLELVDPKDFTNLPTPSVTQLKFSFTSKHP